MSNPADGDVPEQPEIATLLYDDLDDADDTQLDAEAVGRPGRRKKRSRRKRNRLDAEIVEYPVGRAPVLGPGVPGASNASTEPEPLDLAPGRDRSSRPWSTYARRALLLLAVCLLGYVATVAAIKGIRVYEAKQIADEQAATHRAQHAVDVAVCPRFIEIADASTATGPDATKTLRRTSREIRAVLAPDMSPTTATAIRLTAAAYDDLLARMNTDPVDPDLVTAARDTARDRYTTALDLCTALGGEGSTPS